MQDFDHQQNHEFNMARSTADNDQTARNGHSTGALMKSHGLGFRV